MAMKKTAAKSVKKAGGAKKATKVAKKTVAFKNVKAFVKAALAKKLPRGTELSVGANTHVHVTGQVATALAFQGPQTGSAESFLGEVLNAIGVKKVRFV